MKKGFTLIEMLVVIGIIAILTGAAIAGYSKMVKTAERAKGQELVSNVATGLAAYYQENGMWPKKLISGDGRLDKDTALSLAKKKCLSLTTDTEDPKAATKLVGNDRFGVVTPWATTVIKRLGTKAEESSPVGSVTVRDHILYYAIDVDGNGVIEGNEFGQKLEGVDQIRATAAVWCIGKSGGNKGKPWPYSVGRRKDDIYSWSFGQAQKK